MIMIDIYWWNADSWRNGGLLIEPMCSCWRGFKFSPKKVLSSPHRRFYVQPA